MNVALAAVALEPWYACFRPVTDPGRAADERRREPGPGDRRRPLAGRRPGAGRSGPAEGEHDMACDQGQASAARSSW